MQMMSIRLERLDGGRSTGCSPSCIRCCSGPAMSVLSPLILLATLFLDRKRTVHDLLLGTVVMRADR